MERNDHFSGTKGKIPSVLTYAADYVMNFPHMEFSKLTGLGIHTLRYYEQEGLLEPKRNSGNRRRYSDKDLAWIRFIKRLKDTGMPIREIRHYAQLRSDGDPTFLKGWRCWRGTGRRLTSRSHGYRTIKINWKRKSNFTEKKLNV